MSKNNSNTSWPGAFRDIVIAAMNKGQLLVIFAMMIILAIIFKIPNKDVLNLLYNIGNSMSSFTGMSYLLNIFMAGAWFYTSKNFRIMHSEELKRVGTEKQELQKELIRLKNKDKK